MEKAEESFCRLDFVLQELRDSKVINTRSYSMWLSSGEGRGAGASVRAGSEIPIPTALTGTSYGSLALDK